MLEQVAKQLQPAAIVLPDTDRENVLVGTWSDSGSNSRWPSTLN